MKRLLVFALCGEQIMNFSTWLFVATLLEATQCTHGRFYLSVLTVLRSAFSSPHRSTWSYLFDGSFPSLFFLSLYLSLSSSLSHDFFFLPCSLTSRSKSKFCQETFHAGKPVAFSLSSKMLLEISFNVFWFTKSRI